MGKWGAIGKDDVATDTERGVGEGDGDRVVEGGAVRHERGGGDGAGLMQFEDGAVDAAGQAEVVCVDDEARGHLGQR